jgi:hypothetical protein
MNSTPFTGILTLEAFNHQKRHSRLTSAVIQKSATTCSHVLCQEVAQVPTSSLESFSTRSVSPYRHPRIIDTPAQWSVHSRSALFSMTTETRQLPSSELRTATLESTFESLLTMMNSPKRQSALMKYSIPSLGKKVLWKTTPRQAV